MRLLSAAQLTPLRKADGKIRPIAVGELLYRLCAKVLLQRLVSADCLLPCQLGVRSAGGVEPAVRLIERFVRGLAGEEEFNYVTFLDISNAFNALLRSSIHRAILKHCGHLYRFARSRYGTSAPLFYGGGGGKADFESSQGLPQGDPFGPFLFSLAVRDLVAELQAFLGDSVTIVCYFDDWTILSREAGSLERIKAFFAARSDSEVCGLRLNVTKCSEMTREQVRQQGVKALGTMFGSSAARADFLRGKVQEEVEVLKKLPLLPRHDALLLLTQSLQHTLRHLLRTLHTDDLAVPWTELDQALHGTLVHLRGSAGPEGGEEIGRILFSLPTK